MKSTINEDKPLISKQTILCLMAIWVFASIYYQEYKKKKALAELTVLQDISARKLDGTDPVRVKDQDTRCKVVGRIYEGLYSYDFLKRPFELVPNLTEAMPDISEDGLVYTFKIKKGIRFQDDVCFPDGKGRTLRASDVVFTLKRVIAPSSRSPYAALLYGKICGLDDWKANSDYAASVEGLSCLDDYTLRVKLVESWPLFMNFLAMSPAFIVAEEAVKHYGPAFVNHPVGTGPFLLQGGFNPQATRLEFTRNPNFRECVFPDSGSYIDYQGKKLPLVDKIITHVLEEEQPRLLKLQKGEVDLIKADGTDFAPYCMKDGVFLPELSEKGLVLYQEPEAHTEFFAFNHSNPLFSNAYLRQAMAMAFDREAYNQRFCGGEALPAVSLVPSLLMRGQGAIENPYAYNLERAEAYLSKAGFPEGSGLPVITLDVRSETTYKNKAEFFAKCMAKLGIKVVVVTHIWSEFLKQVFQTQDTMMYFLDWWADYPEPSSVLGIICHPNLAGLTYENVGFKKLFQKATATLDEETRYQYYAQLNRMVAEEVPIICAVHRPVQFLHYKWVKNILYNNAAPILDQYISIDKACKAQFAAHK